MKRISVDDFLSLIRYKPKYVGSELVDPVRFIEFPKRLCYTATMEFGTKITDGKGQRIYWEVIDFSNYDTHKGEIITEDRRHDVIDTYLTPENIKDIAAFINNSLKNIYKKDGPSWLQIKKH